VIVTIQGVPSASRYLQYAAPGRRSIAIRASRGTSSEAATAAIAIQGMPMAFRESLGPPALTSLPIINAAPVPGQPYAAALRLGNTQAVRRIRAAALESAAAQHPAPIASAASAGTAARPISAEATARVAWAMGAPAPVIPAPAATLDVFGTMVARAMTALAPETIKKFSPPATVTAQGTATASGLVAAIDNLVPPATTATSYKWDFGDGTTATTQSPSVTHDFFPAIRPGRGAQSFDVTCTAVHDNVTLKRTVTVHSA